MAKLNKQESGRLVRLVEMPGWNDMMRLATLTIAELNAQVTHGTNEFEKLRSVFTKEAKVESLKEFFDGIENGTSLSDTKS